MDSEKMIEAGEPDHNREREKQVDVPPDGGYGWVCTASIFLINAHTWGINSVRYTRALFPVAETILTSGSPMESSLPITYPITPSPAHRPSNMPS
jgi:hypothetical protein